MLSVGKTKYWLSILAVSVVLIAGSLAVSPIAIADDDDDDDDEGDDEFCHGEEGHECGEEHEDEDDHDDGPAPGPVVNCSALVDLLNTLIPPLTSVQANTILILVGCEPVTPDVPPPACTTAADCGDDGDMCTENETCEAGECISGEPISCDDGSECTADSCDSVNGCANDPVPNGTPCAIGAGVCQLGVCLESPGPGSQ